MFAPYNYMTFIVAFFKMVSDNIQTVTLPTQV